MNDYQQGFEHGHVQALANVRVVVDDYFNTWPADGDGDEAMRDALLARINTLEREEQHVQPSHR